MPNRDAIFDILDEFDETGNYEEAYQQIQREYRIYLPTNRRNRRRRPTTKPKRKLSDWQKYIKNKRNHIKYRDGKLNLKKMGVEFRRKKRR
jgi:hypothetical protein